MNREFEDLNWEKDTRKMKDRELADNLGLAKAGAAAYYAREEELKKEMKARDKPHYKGTMFLFQKSVTERVSLVSDKVYRLLKKHKVAASRFTKKSVVVSFHQTDLREKDENGDDET